MCVTHPEQKAGGCIECIKAAVPKPDGFVVPKRDRYIHEFSVHDQEMTS
jgi:hypothetical protein